MRGVSPPSPVNPTANSSGDGGDESFQITIPDDGYHALVVWKVDSGDYAKSATYKIAFGNPYLAVTSPNGGETWYRGELQQITWDIFGDTNSIGLNVKIEISRDSGTTWSTITNSTGNACFRDITLDSCREIRRDSTVRCARFEIK